MSRLMFKRGLTAALGVVMALCSERANAQCGASEPGGEFPGIDGNVRAAALWDPDGPGPRGAVVVLGGAFRVAGGTAVKGLATWDPQSHQWGTLGAGITGPYAVVNALLGTSNGDLVVGGVFESIGSVAARSIAKFDGVSWSSLDGGLNPPNGTVYSLAELPGGGVVVGGAFSGAGGVLSNDVALWTGEWQPMSLPGVAVMALACLPNGDIFAGGSQDLYRRRADGTEWERIAVGQQFLNSVYSLGVLSNGDLIVGGQFDRVAGVQAVCVARWDGSSWSAIGGGVDMSAVMSIAPLANGEFIMGGYFNRAGGLAAPGIVRWAGSAWSGLGPGWHGTVNALASLPDGELIAGGDLYLPGPETRMAVSRWTGAAWTDLVSPGALVSHGSVAAIMQMADSSVVVGGEFDRMHGVAGPGLAVERDGVWSTLGDGLDGPVNSLASAPGGGMLAAGKFTHAGGVAAAGAAIWNGVSWSQAAPGIDAVSSNIRRALYFQGSLHIAGGVIRAGGTGRNSIGRWNGAAWSSVGGGVTADSGASISEMVLLPSGRLAVGGRFDRAGGISANSVAEWDGQRWQSFGGGIEPMAYVWAMCVLEDGRLVVGGYFRHAGGIEARNVAVWDGTSWSAMGSGFEEDVQALTPLLGGGCLASTWRSESGYTGYDVFRWDGQQWLPFVRDFTGEVNTILELADGSVAMGGKFTAVGSVVSPGYARWRPCPADMNCDGFLDFFDADAFLEAFESGAAGADFNGDGFVDFFDFNEYVIAFEAGC